MSLRGIAVAAAVAAVVAVGPQVAARVHAAPPPGSCYTIDTTIQEGDCQQSTTNYSEANVSVWNSPTNPTTVVATGAAGGAFAALSWQSVSTPTSCDSGVQTTTWYYGRDDATNTWGWVPDCYLNGEPN